MGAVPLAPDALIAAAVKRAGCDDFGADDFRAGLDALCASADDEELLHTRGRAELQGTLIHALVSRLEFVALAESAPGLARVPPRRPLLVAGLPRTGTTLLHRLLSLAPEARHLPLWLCLKPLPPPEEREWRGEADPHARRKTAAAVVDASMSRDPELAAIHPMHADAPEECTHLFRATFSTWQYFITSPLLGYATWFLEQDQHAAYRFFRTQLSLLQSDLGGTSWVLKAPQHWGCLSEVLDVFPDADVVCTHRDPARVLGSWCSLLQHLWSQKSSTISARDIGASQLEVLARSTERALTARAAGGGRIVDVSFEALVADPIGCVRRIHERTERELTDAHVRAMERWLAENPRDKHGRHRYAAADFGISDAQLADRFADYRDLLAGLEAGPGR